MKKLVIALALAASLGLAACDDNETVTQPDGVGQVDEECPRADGEPCR